MATQEISSKEILKDFKRQEAELENEITEYTSKITKLQQQLKPIKGVITALQQLHASVQIPGVGRQLPPIPESYSSQLSWTKKILFLLKLRGPSLVSELVSEVLEREPKIPEKKVKGAITFYCSWLKGEGHLGATKEGVRFRYFINEENGQ